MIYTPLLYSVPIWKRWWWRFIDDDTMFSPMDFADCVLGHTDKDYLAYQAAFARE